VPLQTNAPKHCIMVYRFGGLKRAYEFETLVRSFGVPASALSDAVNGWHVKTDSRCLEFAAKLLPFIYKVPKGASS